LLLSGIERRVLAIALPDTGPAKKDFGHNFISVRMKIATLRLKKWSEREDSNLRPPRPERGALPG
jgi:hypothetical protein